MKIINFISPNITLKREQNRLSVYVGDDRKISYPLSFFEGLFCFGNIEIKTSLLSFLLSNGKFVAFFTEKGKLKGLCTGVENQINLKNRIKQYSIFLDEAESLNFCKKVVIQKVKSIEDVFSLNLNKQKEKIIQAKTKEELFGVEGVASLEMFRAYKLLLQSVGVEFNKREYYPPPDPVNSILSSFYNYLYNISIVFLKSKGFDPALGIMHSKKGNHYAFASDVMEVARPYLTMESFRFIKEIGIENLKFVESSNNSVYLDSDSQKLVVRWLVDNSLDELLAILRKFIYYTFSSLEEFN